MIKIISGKKHRYAIREISRVRYKRFHIPVRLSEKGETEIAMFNSGLRLSVVPHSKREDLEYCDKKKAAVGRINIRGTGHGPAAGECEVFKVAMYFPDNDIRKPPGLRRIQMHTAIPVDPESRVNLMIGMADFMDNYRISIYSRREYFCHGNYMPGHL